MREAAATGADDGRSRFVDQRRLDIETFGGLGAVRHQTYGRGGVPPAGAVAAAAAAVAG